MDPKHVVREVKLFYGEKEIEAKALFDTGASRSIISEDIVRELGALVELPETEQYELDTVKTGAKVRITAKASVRMDVAGCRVPSTTFEVTKEIGPKRVIIGRPELDEWEVEFTPEGPKPAHCPVRLEVI